MGSSLHHTVENWVRKLVSLSGLVWSPCCLAFALCSDSRAEDWEWGHLCHRPKEWRREGKRARMQNHELPNGCESI